MTSLSHSLNKRERLGDKVVVHVCIVLVHVACVGRVNRALYAGECTSLCVCVGGWMVECASHVCYAVTPVGDF